MEVFCQNQNTFLITIVIVIVIVSVLCFIVLAFCLQYWYLVFGILSSVLAVGNLGSAAVDARQRIVTKSFHNNP